MRRTLALRGRTHIIKVPGRKRQKVALIAALSVAPQRGRIGLYFGTYPGSHISQHEAAAFMRDVMRQLRGQVHVVWDRGSTQKGVAIRRLHADYPRLTSHWVPPYAPKLNPVEHVWNHLKYGVGANYLPPNLEALDQHAYRVLLEAGRDAQRKRSFFRAAKLSLDQVNLSG